MALGRLISLRGLLAGSLALAAFAGGAAVLVAGSSGDRTGSSGSVAGAHHAAAQLAERLEGALSVAGRDVTLAADNAILKPVSDPEGARRFFARWRALHPEYADVLFADRGGRVQVTASGNYLNADVSGSSWFTRGLGGIVIGDASERSRAGTEAPRNIIVGAPVAGAGAGTGATGVLAVQLTPEWVDEAVALTRRTLGEAGRGYAFTVLNASGRTVHQSGGRSARAAGDAPEATAAFGEGGGPSLGWLVTARRTEEVPAAGVDGLAIVLLGVATLLAGVLGWWLGARLARGLARIRTMAGADDATAPTGSLTTLEIHALADAVRSGVGRRQGRERILQETRAALARSRDRLRAIKTLAGSTCWEIDLAANQVMWTDGSQEGTAGASERVCDLDEVLTRIEAGDRDLLRIALRTAESEPGGIRDIAVRTLPATGEVAGRRLMLRVASTAQGAGAPSRLHVLSREIGIVALAPPAAPAVPAVTVAATGGASEAREDAGMPPERRTDLMTRGIVDGIVHDVNNALTTILTALGTLRRNGEASDRTLQLVEIALRGATRGASLTRRVTALTRREAAPACETDAGAVVEDLVEFIRASLIPEMTVALSVGPDLPLLLCSEREFEIALLNLFNDAKASLPADETISIVVEATQASPDAPIVKRAGVRIVLSASSALLEGSGVASVRDLMEEIGGSVGATVSAQLATIALWFPATEARSASAPLPAPGRRRTLLLVEADPLVRAATLDALADLGHAVTPAASAAHAMDILAQRRDFDLMLCDYALPKTNGLMLAGVVSRTHPAMQIVLMGVRGHLPANAQAFRALYKPFGTGDLTRVVNETPISHERAA